MFENFGTALIQALGFFGVFGFFVYRLLSEKDSNESFKEQTKNKLSKPNKKVISEKKGLFGRKNNVEQNIEVKTKQNKRGWFKR